MRRPFEKAALAVGRTESEPERDLVIPDSRMDAFIAISGEREYQDRRYPNRTPNARAMAILIEEYLNRLKTALVFNEDVHAACAARKIAALAVRMMEYGGVLTRAEEENR